MTTYCGNYTVCQIKHDVISDWKRFLKVYTISQIFPTQKSHVKSTTHQFLTKYLFTYWNYFMLAPGVLRVVCLRNTHTYVRARFNGFLPSETTRVPVEKRLSQTRVTDISSSATSLISHYDRRNNIIECREAAAATSWSSTNVCDKIRFSAYSPPLESVL